jgi:N-methylhydantoinase A
MTATEKKCRIGVDVGGTFTDVVTIQDGQIHVSKTPSTPAAPDRAVIDGVRESKDVVEFDYNKVEFFAHGTTVATNAVLEGNWAETALVTTEGFRDVLEIGRQNRPDIYDFDVQKPQPIVPRNRRFEVPERLDERGRVEIALDAEAAKEVATEILNEDIDSVAISFLFSYENPDHERQLRGILEELGCPSISLSSDVLPEIREYERTLATSLNAALKPVMDSYIGDLKASINELGIQADLQIMQSNGGIISSGLARRRPINTLLSGPAAGVQGAAHVAGLAGVGDIMTMDMGGTSCDVSLVRHGDPVVSTEVEIGEYPVGVPMIAVHTIGAGGGSVAWIDAGDALRVGPQSAGANPGPVCYGRGGTKPTVTDANLLLGRLDASRFLSDELETDTSEVELAIREQIADPLDMDVIAAAQGIVDVANANMERALRVVSVERGYDPREFGLVAYGGAGPLHATTLAKQLDIPRVLVPHTAGVLSALGLLISDLIHDFSSSMVRPWHEIKPADLAPVFQAFESQARDRLSRESLDDDQILIERSVDLRYVGQSFELSIPLPDGEITPESIEATGAEFHDRHAQQYGHSSPTEPIELVTVRLRSRGMVNTPEISATGVSGSLDDAIRTDRQVVFDGFPLDTPVYDRELLPATSEFKGPAIVEGPESTVVIRPDQRAHVDPYGTLIVEVDL